MQPQQPAVPPGPVQNYDFIINPQKPPKAKLQLFNNSSMAKRLLIASGGLLVLIILATIVIKSLSTTTNYFPSVLAVAQDQQVIIVITKDYSLLKLSAANANLLSTAQLTVTSSQTALLNYLAKNGHKVSSAQLNQKAQPSVSNIIQGTNQVAGNADQTFDSAMLTHLQTYQQDLKTAYIKDKGAKGRALLNSDYNQAQLLLNSLPAQTSATN